MINIHYLTFFLKVFSFKIIRWVISFLCLVGLSIYSTIQIDKLSFETGYTFNLYDILFYEFGIFMYIFLIIIPIYLYLINDTFIDNRLDTYIYIRITDKKEIWKHKIIQIFVTTLTYISIAVITTIVIGGLSYGFPNDWSEGSKKINSLFSQEEFRYIGSDFLEFNPYFSFLMLISLLILGLFALGILVNIVTLLIKKPIVSYITGLILNFLMLICFKYNDMIGIHVLPYQHFLLIFRETSYNFYDFRSIIFSYYYWILTILILIWLSLKLFKKISYIFEVKEYD